MDTTPASPLPDLNVLRYDDVAAAYRTSRRTVERWVDAGTAPPYYRDPSNRPYRLEHELREFMQQPSERVVPRTGSVDDRLEQLRRASARNNRRN